MTLSKHWNVHCLGLAKAARRSKVAEKDVRSYQPVTRGKGEVRSREGDRSAPCTRV